MQYNLSIVVRRGDEISDVWVAHCLECDVITHGDSLLEALDNIPEAVNIVMQDWAESGRKTELLFGQTGPKDIEQLRRVHTDDFWVLIRRSEEIDGEWLAEVPDLTYIAQGRSPLLALEAANEGIGMIHARGRIAKRLIVGGMEMLVVEDEESGRLIGRIDSLGQAVHGEDENELIRNATYVLDALAKMQRVAEDGDI